MNSAETTDVWTVPFGFQMCTGALLRKNEQMFSEARERKVLAKQRQAGACLLGNGHYVFFHADFN